MADAYFRIRHEPVATLTSCGPGSANIVMPLACARSVGLPSVATIAERLAAQLDAQPAPQVQP